MTTEKLSMTSFKSQVERSWLTRIGYARNPLELPAVLELERGQMPMPIGSDQGPRPGAYLLEDKSVSKNHAELRFRDEAFELVDLGSSNGTSVNGTPLLPDAPHRLKDGDLIQMGGSFLCFRAGLFDKNTVPKTPTKNETLTSVCPEFISEVHELRGAALTDAPVLIHGETGTGKEVFARALHELSRRTGEYVAVNTAGLQAGLVPAELYGVARGAHSTAENGRPGLIRSADQGTVLLDEIGDMPMQIQPSLLRIIQEGAVLPVGGDKYIPVDVRWIAATHRDPTDATNLRPDLVGRLAATKVTIPPLRERMEDFGLLVARILAELGGDNVQFAPDAYARMLYFDWPKNVRQLYHFLKRVVGLSFDVVTVDILYKAEIGHPPATKKQNEDSDWDPEHMKTWLREHSGSVTGLSRHLGVNRMKIHRFLKDHGIDANAYRAKPMKKKPRRTPVRKKGKSPVTS